MRSTWLSDTEEYRRKLKEAALDGLQRDLQRLADTAGHAGGVLAAPQIGLALHTLRAALAGVTAEQYPDLADYAAEVAAVAMRVTAQFMPRRAD